MAKNKELRLEDFVFLNDSKLELAITRAGEKADIYSVLVEYDKLGGGLKKDGRKVAMGTFYDFENKRAKKDVDTSKLGENDFEDEYVLQHKPKAKPAKVDTSARLKARLARVSQETLAPIVATSKKKEEPETE